MKHRIVFKLLLAKVAFVARLKTAFIIIYKTIVTGSQGQQKLK